MTEAAKDSGIREVLLLRYFDLQAPFTEELVFRACMISLLLCGGFKVCNIIFLNPVFFSLAHLNHFFELQQQGCNLMRSLLIIVLIGIRPSCCPPSWAFAAVRAQKLQVPKRKKRLDEVCLERFQQYSRTYIQSWILQGKVHVNGRVVNKAGTQVSDQSVIEIKAEIPKYVCRAGHKLEAAIKEFGVDCDGKIALDSGLSTGGFTDCLLQHGASHVYGVDVGYGQVSVIERTNLRYLSPLPQLVDLVTLDLSFISILKVIPAVIKVMKTDSILITLIKPQFEARRSQVGSGGIVRDPLVHTEVLDRIISGVEEFGFCNKGWIESPIKGAEGNKEFLACFHRIATPEPQPEAQVEATET